MEYPTERCGQYFGQESIWGLVGACWAPFAFLRTLRPSSSAAGTAAAARASCNRWIADGARA